MDLGFHNPRIADAIMECPFFLIESRHDVANGQGDRADKLCKEPAAGPGIADFFAIRSHYLETAGHFTRGGAVCAYEIGGIGNAKGKGKDVLEDGDCDCVPYDKTYKKSESKSNDTKDDSVNEFGSKAYPESCIHHFSCYRYTFPQLLYKERLALTAHQSITELDQLILKIHFPALTAVFRPPRRLTI